MGKNPFYLEQPLSENIIETVLITLTLLFLAYVVKLALTDDENDG
ncbi:MULTISPECIES: hypothetical protein [Neisseria]|nr:hypothetical protein [Neisseria arctica]